LCDYYFTRNPGLNLFAGDMQNPQLQKIVLSSHSAV
jgi:hypothetical protein